MLIRVWRFAPPGSSPHPKGAAALADLVIVAAVVILVAWNALPAGIELEDNQVTIGGLWYQL